MTAVGRLTVGVVTTVIADVSRARLICVVKLALVSGETRSDVHM